MCVFFFVLGLARVSGVMTDFSLHKVRDSCLLFLRCSRVQGKQDKAGIVLFGWKQNAVETVP